MSHEKVAADERDLEEVTRPDGTGKIAATLRALVRRIVDLGGSLRGRIARGEDRLNALEKEGAELARHVRRLDGSAHARLSALETTAAGKAETEEAIADLGRKATATHDFACTISSHLGKAEHRIAALETDLRGARETLADLRRWAGLDMAAPEVLDYDGNGHRFPSFVRYTPAADMRTAGLTPQRVYAVIGRDTRYVRLEGDDGKPVDIAPPFLVAVPGPADPKPNPTNARHFETIRKAEAEVKAAATLSRACERIRDFWEKDAGKDGLLVSLVEGLIMATAEAKRAGVIP